LNGRDLRAREKGKEMRVLLIEDDSAIAQSIELMLKSENFNVYTTDLGKKASISASSTTTTSFSWI
jgi:DNA-binding response OmpR family regulator